MLKCSDGMPQLANHGLFKAQMDNEAGDEIRASSNGDYAVGNEHFKEQVSDILKRRHVPGEREGRYV